MNPELESNSGNGREHDSLESTAAMKPDRLLDAARSYFSADFSNPSRSGCPPAGSIENYLRAAKFPSEELRKHLFGCSECFREYCEAVERNRNAVTSKKSPSWWERLGWGRLRLAPTYALLAAVIFVSAVVFFASRGGGGEDGNRSNGAATSAVAPSPAVPSPTSSSASSGTPRAITDAPGDATAQTASPTRPPGPSSVVKEQRARRKGPTLGTVLIDLASYSILRADDADADIARSATLPPAVNHLRILLPEGSPQGGYRVTIVDAFGAPLTSEQAARSSGKKIEVVVDTRKLAGRRCRLRISHREGAPDYYPINVSGR